MCKVRLYFLLKSQPNFLQCLYKVSPVGAGERGERKQPEPVQHPVPALPRLGPETGKIYLIPFPPCLAQNPSRKPSSW